MSPGTARRVLVVAVPLVLAIVLLAPAVLGGKVMSASDLPLFQAPFTPPPGATPQNPLQYDSAYVFEPDALQVRDALRGGRLPTWSGAQSAGVPLLASQQSAPLFPLTWLGVVGPFWSSLAWIALIKLVLAGLGTALFCRALGQGLAATLLAGITFAFGTYFVVWLMHPHVNAYLLLPWLMLLGERLCRSGTIRDAGLLSVVTGIAWLSGQPESALLVTLATAAWVAYRLAASDLPRGAGIRRGLLAAAAGIAGVALAAIMLIPFAEALAHATETSRARPPLPLRAAVTLIAPDYWGRPNGVEVPGGPSNFTERTLYAGVLPTLLAFAGLVARRPSGPQWFMAGLAGVGAAVSWDTGPVQSVIAGLPVLSAVNITRALVLTAFALAVLAGFGLDRLLDATALERRRMLAAAAGAVLLPALALLATGPGHIAADALWRWLAIGVVGVAVLAAARRRRAGVAVAVCLLAAADLVAVGHGYNPMISQAQAEPPPTPALGALHRLTGGGGRVMGIGGLEPNTASRWGLADARGHEQPTIERTARLYDTLAAPILVPTAEHVADRAGPLLDAFGVRALVLPPGRRPAPEPAAPSRAGGRRVVYAGPDGTVIANPSALPPAWVAYSWRRSPGLAQSVRLTTTRPARALRDDPAIETAAAPPAGGAATAATPARVIERTDTRVVLGVDAARPGRLVLLDTFYPGWHAEVDGRPVHIEAADAAFRAVPVGRGRHTVRFDYRPASVRAGGVVSLVALLVLAAAIALPRRRRRARV